MYTHLTVFQLFYCGTLIGQMYAPSPHSVLFFVVIHLHEIHYPAKYQLFKHH